MPPDNCPFIDIHHTTRILGVTVEFYKKILNRFAAARDEYLLPMMRYAEEGKYCELATAAHKLKGAAAYLNIEEIKNMAIEMETLARKNQPADYMQIINKIFAVFNGIAAMKELQE